jgi:hypothetical protein
MKNHYSKINDINQSMHSDIGQKFLCHLRTSLQQRPILVQHLPEPQNLTRGFGISTWRLVPATTGCSLSEVKAVPAPTARIGLSI